MNVHAHIEALRLLETDELIGVHSWPLACYVSEALENELTTIKTLPTRRLADRQRLAIRRVIKQAASYAEGYRVPIAVFSAAARIKQGYL